MDLALSNPSSSHSMADQPVRRLFWRYTLPAVFGMLVNGLYSTVDGIFIGQVVGTDGLAATNLAWPALGVMVGIGMMIGTGASAHYAIARGEGNHEKARRVLGSALLLMLVVGLLQTVVMLLLGQTILVLMGAKGSLMTMASSYLEYISLGALAATAGTALPMMVRNDERPQLATWIIATGAIVNIMLDYVLIILLDQGVGGAAIATIMAESIAAIWGLLYFLSPKARLGIRFKHIDWHGRCYRQILATGLPSLMMFVYLSFVLAVHNRLFLSYGTVVTLAAFTIVGYIQTVYYIIAEGIAAGMQPIVSFNKGAGNNQNIRIAITLSMRAALIVGLITVAAVNIWPTQVAALFNSQDLTLINETALGLRLHLFSMFLDGFIVVAAVYFQAMDNAKVATWIALGNMLVQIPLLLSLPDWLGVIGVWLALPVSNVLLAAVVLYAILYDLKQRPATAVM